MWRNCLGFVMSRSGLYVIIAVLVLVLGGVAVYAYQQNEKDQNTLEIEVGPGGVKVDPPGS